MPDGNLKQRTKYALPGGGKEPLLGTNHAGSPPKKPKLKTVDEFVYYYWSVFAEVDRPNVFEHGGVTIAKDGGMADVKGKLLYNAQYFYAALSLIFVTANTYMLTAADVAAVMEASEEGTTSEIEKQFLLSKWLVERLVGSQFPLVGDKIERVVPLFELLALWGIICTGVFHVMCAILARKLYKERTWHMKRWMHTKDFFWVIMPNLASFSAMRLLYYVTPTVIGTEAYVIGYLVTQGWRVAKTTQARLKAVWPIITYIFKLVFCLCIGFDAFLVKFRMAEQFINNKDDDEMSAQSLLGACIFLFQILGVVNLNFFVRLRLFIFIFGGEDGNFDIDEKARTDVWNAMLARKIFQEHGPIKGTVIMLGFDDYDFQLLVLEDSLARQESYGRSSEIMLKGGIMDDVHAVRGAVDDIISIITD